MVSLRRTWLAGAVLTLMVAACTDSADEVRSESSPASPTTEAASPGKPGSSSSDGGDYGGEIAPPRELTVVMSGDVLIHTGVWESARADAAAAGRSGMDFRPMFASMEPVYTDADLAICHLEVPLAERDGPFLNYPIFSAPPQVVRGLKAAGIDTCTTASNHSLDTGLEGLLRTLRTLDEKGVGHAGTAATRKQSKTPVIVDVDGVSVALLSYSYGTNGIPIPSEAPWSVPLIDTEKILRVAAKARAAGAEIVLVALHAGTEYTTSPNEQQLEVFDALTKSPDIDLVYGHHAHVPQPIDVVNGNWVAYGLGNFVAQQSTDVPDTYRGVTARFEFVEQPDGTFEVRKARFIPTMITPASGGPMRVLNAPAALRDPDTEPALLSSLRDAVANVRQDVFSLGARKHGLRMAH